jgi:hypothetical protein
MRGAAKVGIRWFVVILPRGGGVAAAGFTRAGELEKCRIV